MDPHSQYRHPHHHSHPHRHSPSPSQSRSRSTRSTNTFAASPAPMHRGHCQFDEGFSEETRSQADSDMADSTDGEASNKAMIAMLAKLPLEQRCQIVEALAPNIPPQNRHHLAALLIRTLPNSDKENLGGLCERLTKFDPVYTLPNELMLQVFSYLSPKDLLTCSNVSSAWRPRTRDEKLWRGCFAREGWVVDRAKLATFEERERRRMVTEAPTKKGRGVNPLERKGSRKRKTEEAFSEGEAATDAASDGMEGVESSTPAAITPTAGAVVQLNSRRTSTDSAVSMDSNNDNPPSDVQISPPMFRSGFNDDHKLSWPFLYKQRCRLEKNWEKGAYKPFQLPHPRHPEEGHTECVYTIQHTPTHLVSGSRDKSIRVWDVDKQRLLRILRGHEASVLCLQFDERPEHDIIVSGGSDSYVIIWRFSTGEILQKLTQAHSESVLNLRFDDNYIVTCSKDKLIKVWNRRALARDDPLVPSHILPSLPPLTSEPEENLIKAYTLFATLSGHQAAVNAVIIHESTIVSASGDRTIKSWSLPSGKLNKTYIGHTKGIACVQFDGRRIVSGSSDNTVRIFDAENQAEVACLSSHSNLVRTVQARFGDLETVSSEELEEQARTADRNYFEAVEKGMVPASVSRHARRNAGSARPDKMLSTGTMVPPGGGGGRWAKIVSGSYDEMVQIWKRGREGEWEVGLKLRLNGRDGEGVGRGGRQHRAWGAAQQPMTLAQAQAVLHQAQQHMLMSTQQQQNPNAPLLTMSQVAAASAVVQAHQQQAQGPGGPFLPAVAAAPAGTLLQAGPPSNTTTTTTTTMSAINALLNPPHQPHHTNQQAHPQPPLPTAHPAPPPAPTTSTTTAPPTTTTSTALIHPVPQPPPNPPPHHHRHHGSSSSQDSNRVFKLQFDARRIICCSQNKVIVGWDFANGERELELVGGWSVETA